MTGERVFCSRLKRKVPTNLNPPATGVNVTAPGTKTPGDCKCFFSFCRIACAGLFCGAALYVSFVEHPAGMSCTAINLTMAAVGPGDNS